MDTTENGNRIRLDIQSQLDRLGWTLAELGRQSGIRYSHLHRLATTRVERYDSTVLTKLCVAFKCQPGDLLRLS